MRGSKISKRERTEHNFYPFGMTPTSSVKGENLEGRSAR